jgi:hypothetical protein
MEKVTSETIKANFPSIWWEIYKTGYREALADPQAIKRAAKTHLESDLTMPAGAAPAAAEASGVQAQINKQLGLDEKTFQEFAGRQDNRRRGS